MVKPNSDINNHVFSIIGGDKRSIAAAKQLSATGYTVRLFAFNEEQQLPEGTIRAQTLEEAITGAQYILLPLPCSQSAETLFTPLYDQTVLKRDVLARLNSNQVVFAGRLDKQLMDDLAAKHLCYYDYTLREEFSVLNAIATSEGAILLAMENLPTTLNNARCLVLGFGRIAKILAHTLKALGASVCAAARRKSDLAWMQAYGYDALPIETVKEHLQGFQIIFNTVPCLLLDDIALRQTKKDCLVIDLASKPGGAETVFR